ALAGAAAAPRAAAHPLRSADRAFRLQDRRGRRNRGARGVGQAAHRRAHRRRRRTSYGAKGPAMKVLIPGITGRLARLVATKLATAGHQVIGIARRPWPNAPKEIEVCQTDIRKRAAEEVFRKHRPEAVIHMATVTHLTVRNEDRFRINLFGTRAVFDHCAHYGTKRCIFVGRHTYYGAAADSSLYHGEEDPPFAMTTFPELADLVAADLYAGSALWRYPELDTSVLRLCYTLGPSVSGTLA